jgi:hypothetical protein
VAVSDRPSAVGWRFFLWWMLTFLGFLLGGELALIVVGPVEGAVSGALGGALAGAVIGATQWLVLRRYVRVGPEWVLATALGVAIADASRQCHAANYWLLLSERDYYGCRSGLMQEAVDGGEG